MKIRRPSDEEMSQVHDRRNWIGVGVVDRHNSVSDRYIC